MKDLRKDFVKYRDRIGDLQTPVLPTTTIVEVEVGTGNKKKKVKKVFENRSLSDLWKGAIVPHAMRANRAAEYHASPANWDLDDKGNAERVMASRTRKFTNEAIVLSNKLRQTVQRLSRSQLIEKRNYWVGVKFGKIGSVPLGQQQGPAQGEAVELARAEARKQFVKERQKQIDRVTKLIADARDLLARALELEEARIVASLDGSTPTQKQKKALEEMVVLRLSISEFPPSKARPNDSVQFGRLILRWMNKRNSI